MKRMHNKLLVCILLLLPMMSMAQEKPEVLIETTVQKLLDEFTSQRAELDADKRKLFALVERVAVPVFDTKRISKLVLAKNWKQASEQQRAEFTVEFKNLLISTYAIALFKYTGGEDMTFIGSKITERKGRKFALVKSAVTLSSGGTPIAVNYSMLLGKDNQWRIYNLEINGLNMITSYRSTYSAAIDRLGLDGMIESLKEANAKNL